MEMEAGMVVKKLVTPTNNGNEDKSYTISYPHNIASKKSSFLGHHISPHIFAYIFLSLGYPYLHNFAYIYFPFLG